MIKIVLSIWLRTICFSYGKILLRMLKKKKIKKFFYLYLGKHNYEHKFHNNNNII